MVDNPNDEIKAEKPSALQNFSEVIGYVKKLGPKVPSYLKNVASQVSSLYETISSHPQVKEMMEAIKENLEKKGILRDFVEAGKVAKGKPGERETELGAINPSALPGGPDGSPENETSQVDTNVLDMLRQLSKEELEEILNKLGLNINVNDSEEILESQQPGDENNQKDKSDGDIRELVVGVIPGREEVSEFVEAGLGIPREESDVSSQVINGKSLDEPVMVPKDGLGEEEVLSAGNNTLRLSEIEKEVSEQQEESLEEQEKALVEQEKSQKKQEKSLEVKIAKQRQEEYGYVRSSQHPVVQGDDDDGTLVDAEAVNNNELEVTTPPPQVYDDGFAKDVKEVDGAQSPVVNEHGVELDTNPNRPDALKDLDPDATVGWNDGVNLKKGEYLAERDAKGRMQILGRDNDGNLFKITEGEIGEVVDFPKDHPLYEKLNTPLEEEGGFDASVEVLKAQSSLSSELSGYTKVEPQGGPTYVPPTAENLVEPPKEGSKREIEKIKEDVATEENVLNQGLEYVKAKSNELEKGVISENTVKDLSTSFDEVYEKYKDSLKARGLEDTKNLSMNGGERKTVEAGVINTSIYLASLDKANNGYGMTAPNGTATLMFNEDGTSRFEVSEGDDVKKMDYIQAKEFTEAILKNDREADFFKLSSALYSHSPENYVKDAISGYDFGKTEISALEGNSTVALGEKGFAFTSSEGLTQGIIIDDKGDVKGFTSGLIEKNELSSEDIENYKDTVLNMFPDSPLAATLRGEKYPVTKDTTNEGDPAKKSKKGKKGKKGKNDKEGPISDWEQVTGLRNGENPRQEEEDRKAGIGIEVEKEKGKGNNNKEVNPFVAKALEQNNNVK